MTALEHVEVDEETSALEWPPQEWMRAVLETVLARMYPDRGREDALVEAIASLENPDGAAGLQERLVSAASSQAQFGKLLRDGIARLASVPEEVSELT
jgi:hypothetical protein